MEIGLNNKLSSESVFDWLVHHNNEEEIRSLFLNIDRALKYIHEHGYCISVFHPTEIRILNDQIDHIQFNKLMELPSDSILRKKMINEDIFNSSYIQISIYFNKGMSKDDTILLDPDFLKSNFAGFAQFLPSGDVPYYRGVIERGASVYFCEYALEKRNRDLQELEKQIQGDGEASKTLQYKRMNNESLTNDEVNDVIYRQINGMKEAAFVQTLIIPTMILVVLTLFALVGFIVSCFNT